MASASGYNHQRFARAVLKKSRKWEPSLVVQLYQSHWRFENSVCPLRYRLWSMSSQPRPVQSPAALCELASIMLCAPSETRPSPRLCLGADYRLHMLTPSPTNRLPLPSRLFLCSHFPLLLLTTASRLLFQPAPSLPLFYLSPTANNVPILRPHASVPPRPPRSGHPRLAHPLPVRHSPAHFVR